MTEKIFAGKKPDDGDFWSSGKNDDKEDLTSRTFSRSEISVIEKYDDHCFVFK
jgi:hypothetical protein